MFVCLSPGGQSLTNGEAQLDKLLVATAEGIFPFQKRGNSWERQDTMIPGKHFSAVICEPNSKTLLGGTYSGEIFASGDAGKTWERRDQGIGGKEIYSLAGQMVNGKPRVYAGTQPAHLYYSDDLGKSWTELPGLRHVPGVEKWTFPGPPHQAHAKSITFHPSNPDIIHVAVEVGGFLRSIDGGKTWTTIDNINPDAHRVLIPANDPTKLYGTAPTTNCGPETVAGFCVSSDGGASWKSMTPRDFRIGYVDPFFVHPKDPNLLFVAGAKTGPGTWRKLHTADSRVARSRDGGKTWEILAGGLPEHIRANIEAMAMDAWNGGYALFAGTTDGDVFYSDDEGERWQTIIRGIGPVSKSHHYVNLSLDEQPAHH
jgi:BNR/Asp-box repeat